MEKEYVRLNKIGTKLIGGVLGKLLIDTLISRSKKGKVVIIDCKDIVYIGDDLIWGGKMAWKDYNTVEKDVVENITVSIINATPTVLGRLVQIFTIPNY